MTRRMQANSEFHDRHSHLNSAYHSHCYEHDEGSGCKTAPACMPVVRRMVRDGSEHNETDWCTNGGGCTPVVDDTDNATVAVPATGTVLVIDGVVQDIKHIGFGEVENRVYTITVRPPKPSFFEVNKRYRRKNSWGRVWHFEPESVKESSQGNPIAFGRIDTGDGAYIWGTRSVFSDWEEV